MVAGVLGICENITIRNLEKVGSALWGSILVHFFNGQRNSRNVFKCFLAKHSLKNIKNINFNDFLCVWNLALGSSYLLRGV